MRLNWCRVGPSPVWLVPLQKEEIWSQRHHTEEALWRWRQRSEWCLWYFLSQQPQQTHTTWVRVKLLKGQLFRSVSLLKPNECSIHSIDSIFYIVPCKREIVLWGIREKGEQTAITTQSIAFLLGRKVLRNAEEHLHSDGKVTSAYICHSLAGMVAEIQSERAWLRTSQSHQPAIFQDLAVWHLHLLP